MAADSDDPTLLFTPVRSALSSRNSVATNKTPPFTSVSPDAPTRREDANDARFYVVVPKLSKEELAKYHPLEHVEFDTESDSEGMSKVEEIEGEHQLGNKRFLFARYGDGLLRRKEDWEFKSSFLGLYDDYMKKKEEGKLAPFDPSSTRIHPKHRIRLVLNLQKRKPGASKEKDYVSDSEASEEDEEESDSEEYMLRGTRASKRQASKHMRVLPYSPRRTRARRGGRTRPISVDEDDSESEQDHPRRRSSRTTKRKSYTVADDSDYEDELEGSSDFEDSRPGHKLKRVVKRKGPKPAYGRIRKVDDLYDSDPDTAALRGHRDECEKCHRAPAHILLKKLGKKTKRKKNDDDGLSENDEEFFNKLGGWVRCLKCCVAAHWNCLARNQQAEIVKCARAKIEAEHDEANGAPTRIKDLDIAETTEFVCGSCSKGGICMICQEVAVEPEQKSSEPASAGVPDGGTNEFGENSTYEAQSSRLVLEPAPELLFRCYTCKRLAHYSHLPVEDEDLTPTEIAQFYQKENRWQCGDCASYVFPLDKIIAWRPFPANAVDRYMTSPESANYKESLPREYLVKWVGRSFRRVEWVPHMWLVATHWKRLKNFYELGPRPDILSSLVDEGFLSAKENAAEPNLFITEDETSRAVSAEAEHTNGTPAGPPPPILDAESRIPPLWKTVDRVLDVLLWAPRKANGHSQKKGISSKKNIEGDKDSEVEAAAEARAEYDAALDLGEEPSTDVTETIDEFEKRIGRDLGEEHIGRVIWAFFKWDDLPYDESTWDSPPRPGSFGYADYERAFEYFLLSRKVLVRKKPTTEIAKFEDRKSWGSTKLGVPEDGKYDIGQEGNFKLMPFQVQGVNWLCRNWFHHQQCILADEMGLGKTVQIITFLGLLHARMRAFPCLVVVPNSTITNWLREFARWAPGLRVVPFYGEQKSREIIKKYELQHPVVASGTTGAKYHVLVTTYEAATNSRDFNSVFRKNPRWEVLIVDEGQRLKSDSSLIFKRLKELNSCHRIIMTGTPLNNNIRELFNLMNFLDPDKWSDLEALTREFDELDEERVKELHERLRPYFLRRVKAEVLDLPSKNEVIVPMSMAPLQKEIYKSILSKNLTILQSLSGTSSTRLNKSAIKTSNLRNMLMQLRKCLQHPYLIADDIEPKGLSPIDAHLKLIDASGKLRFLKMLLPKLKARGHRVLLFSQFVIALNIIEDFLQGEGYKFLRLDGNTKQAERQKDMDEFNKENSDVFIYILSTRAGGVGINLWSADTVIIFDPDFNPHQDLQAIARAHRYGQKKTCLVFKFMTKNSAEEKIVQTGKKKLVLDHLIVQKMDDGEDSGEVQSILTFGAKALFDEEGGEGNRDITYSENDVETLIEKIEAEEDKKETAETSSNAFSFAKVWSAHNDDLDELPEENDVDQGDSWALTLQKIAAEKDRVETREEVGRGVRRKAALSKKKYFEDGSPDKIAPKGKKRQKLGISGSSDDEYNLPQTREVSEAPTTDTNVTELDLNVERKKRKVDIDERPLNAPKPETKTGHFLSPILNQDRAEFCGLCSTTHSPGGCRMLDDSKNLVEYRKLLIHSNEESYEVLAKAIRAIDECLSKRGVLYLISGQPLKPLKKRDVNQSGQIAVGADLQASSSSGQHFHTFSSRPSSAMADKDHVLKWREIKRSDGVPQSKGSTGTPSATTVSLKRNLSPMLETAVTKKTKLRTCEICMAAPYHLPVHCPVVAKGPDSIKNAIFRLTNERGNTGTLTALRGILRKQRRVLESHVLAGGAGSPPSVSCVSGSESTFRAQPGAAQPAASTSNS